MNVKRTNRKKPTKTDGGSLQRKGNLGKLADSGGKYATFELSSSLGFQVFLFLEPQTPIQMTQPY
jgi:hypothetical protein